VESDLSISARNTLAWVVVATAIAVPIAAAVMSPLLQWRDPIYIVAGFAGIIAMALLLVQPLLAAGNLPGVSAQRGRRVHRWIGGGLIAAVLVHVAALWITSPPDVVDALLFVSPTPFSIWGVVAMWAIFASGLIAALRHRFRLRVWRLAHTILAVVIVVGTVVHAMLIEGTMETVTKALLSVFVAAATLKAIADLKCWVKGRQ
jgi:predicted ferric reductase